MMAFLGDFTEPFILAVAIWPFASAVLTLPVLAMLYHRENRIRLTSVAVSYGCVLYLLALGCFTLYPMPQDAAAYCATHHLAPQLDPLRFIGDIRTDGVTALLQIGMNIVFFVPLGFILGRFLRAGLARTALMGFALSLLIETAQLTGIFHLYPCSYRLFDVNDLIWNTSGALLGYAVAALANHALPRRDVDEGIVTEPGFVRRCVAFCIDYVITGIVSVPCTAIVYLVGIQFAGFRPLTFAMGGSGVPGLSGRHRTVDPVGARRTHPGGRVRPDERGDQGKARRPAGRILSGALRGDLHGRVPADRERGSRARRRHARSRGVLAGRAPHAL